MLSPFTDDCMLFLLQDMLFKRTCLMISYEDANRALDKAKPAKKSAVSHC